MNEKNHDMFSNTCFQISYYIYKHFITGGAHVFMGFISNFSVYLQVIDEDHSHTNKKLSDVLITSSGYSISYQTY